MEKFKYQLALEERQMKPEEFPDVIQQNIKVVEDKIVEFGKLPDEEHEKIEELGAELDKLDSELSHQIASFQPPAPIAAPAETVEPAKPAAAAQPAASEQPAETVHAEVIEEPAPTPQQTPKKKNNLGKGLLIAGVIFLTLGAAASFMKNEK